ncbi:MAG: SCO family protein, partial [Bdellovibrionales bacterium]|nr:SCO family protein [Bdellovibrionales bacterium]
NFHLNGVVETLKKMDWIPGQEFELLAISIDPKETPELAAAKKASYMKLYDRPDAAKGFHFMVGDQANITALTSQVGFGYKWDEGSRQWAHSSAAIFLAPTGMITRYLHGISFSEKTFRLSLVEASEGKIGAIIDKVVLFCFQYDPAQRGYALYAYNIVRGGAAMAVLALGFYFFVFWRRQREELS